MRLSGSRRVYVHPSPSNACAWICLPLGDCPVLRRPCCGVQGEIRSGGAGAWSIREPPTLAQTSSEPCDRDPTGVGECCYSRAADSVACSLPSVGALRRLPG